MLEKTFGADVIYFHPKLVRDLDVLAQWDSAQNEQWMWMTKICKNEKKKSESRIEDQWGRKAVLAGKAEIRNM